MSEYGVKHCHKEADTPIVSPFIPFIVQSIGLIFLLILFCYTIYKLFFTSSHVTYRLKIPVMVYLTAVSIHLSLQVIAEGPAFYYNWYVFISVAKLYIFRTQNRTCTYFYKFNQNYISVSFLGVKT